MPRGNLYLSHALHSCPPMAAMAQIRRLLPWIFGAATIEFGAINKLLVS